MYKAIYQAEQFIYVAGWSVDVRVKLVRTPAEVGDEGIDFDLTVGELLKKKAAEGVKVLLLVWDEKLSTEDFKAGIMHTNDVVTRDYFEGSSVECQLVSRVKFTSVLADEFVATCYAHHQKNVIVDGPVKGSELRTVVAFAGGLDITGGRYDSLDFPLWSTLNTIHQGDFYQNCIKDTNQYMGPRQPWHDCHAKIEGKAAGDIKRNFEERWYKQLPKQVSLLEGNRVDFQFDFNDHADFNWHVQVFRSITSESCNFALDRHKFLSNKEGRLLDKSIQNCLVQQIRNAKNFIYIENQYFMGSAYAWYESRDVVCNHLIPREIAQKIVNKIAAREQFKVYILVPMFPEGDPESSTVQEMLFWQRLTMDSMYRRIACAIQEFQPKSEDNPDELALPTDYLSFYCMAKQESADECPQDLQEPRPGSVPGLCRAHSHAPIYIHAKMAIFDDEYVLVGSANVNQRSMDGGRDTEIAIGAFQLNSDGVVDSKADVHMYRLALWSAHFGGYKEDFLHPESPQCLQSVRTLTQDFWQLYTSGQTPEHSDVRVLPYPIAVDPQKGAVSSLDPPFDCFPDTGGKVLGERSFLNPVKKLTT